MLRTCLCGYDALLLCVILVCFLFVFIYTTFKIKKFEAALNEEIYTLRDFLCEYRHKISRVLVSLTLWVPPSFL